MTAYLMGRRWRQAGLELPPDTPYERWGYWIRRGYTDHTDH